MNRTAIFAFYDKDAIIDDYVIKYIQELKKVCLRVIFVSCVELPEYEKEKIKRFANLIIDENHNEYDFGSYKRGFKYIDTETTDELLLVNDSCYGPLFPLDKIFDKMQSQICDYWGLTENKYGLIKIGDKYKSVKRAHLQSYFMLFKKHVIQSETFREFINSVQAEHKKNDVIINYEIGLSEKLKNEGFVYQTYINNHSDNPTIYKWDELVLQYNFPFIKCSLLRLANNNTVTVNGWRELVRNVSDYPTYIIDKNLERTFAHEPNDINMPKFSKQMYFGLLSTLPKNIIRKINNNGNVLYNIFKD